MKNSAVYWLFFKESVTSLYYFCIYVFLPQFRWVERRERERNRQVERRERNRQVKSREANRQIENREGNRQVENREGNRKQGG